jgi:hypothetical protein
MWCGVMRCDVKQIKVKKEFIRNVYLQMVSLILRMSEQWGKNQRLRIAAAYERKKLDVYKTCTNFLIVGSSCGRIPDKQRVPPGVVKLHKVAASMLKGPCIDGLVDKAICEFMLLE